MHRRSFLTLLGTSAAATAWPLAARAQQPGMPVVGFLHAGLTAIETRSLADFHKGLSDAGYVEGRNVMIEYRWAEGRFNRLPGLAADLVRRGVSVIVTSNGARAALEAKAATSTIPIVFLIGTDPVMLGLVASLNRPGGNATGVSFITEELGAKRLDLLQKLVPSANKIAYLKVASVTSDRQESDILAAARVLGQQITIVEATGFATFEAAFAPVLANGIDALIVAAHPALFNNRDRIVALAARYKIPAVYPDFVSAFRGGLMSYGAGRGLYRQVASQYVGPILKGAKPADLPVQQPTKFELTINLKTAKALGIEVPPMLLALADEVIE
jgi:putative ABC transport system substrate-binding protein